ncbi:unnamed protein product [Amoebophrya sp. A25]|nr:unnamed protein product [Amoebophrya sp. A25]|eukprot:GSA25T00007102001.1
MPQSTEIYHFEGSETTTSDLSFLHQRSLLMPEGLQGSEYYPDLVQTIYLMGCAVKTSERHVEKLKSAWPAHLRERVSLVHGTDMEHKYLGSLGIYPDDLLNRVRSFLQGKNKSTRDGILEKLCD